jgi:hypothetical protein
MGTSTENVDELLDLGVGRPHRGIRSQHPVDLLVGPGQHLRLVQQEIDGEGEQPTRRLVPGDQERDDLVADVDVVEPLARPPVHAGEHVAQQVGLGRQILTARPPLPDDPVDQLVHVLDVGAELPLSLSLDDVLERQPARLPRCGQRATHGVDERVLPCAVEGVEAVVEPAEPDGVQGQRGHVADDVDLVLGVEPLPLGHQLLGDVEHHRMVALHRPLAEVGQQDVVGFGPVGLLGLRGEETVAGEAAHPPQGASDALVEARLVAQLVDQPEARDDEQDTTSNVEPVDGPVLSGELHQILRRCPRADRQQVPEQEGRRGVGNAVQAILRGHDHPLQ